MHGGEIFVVVSSTVKEENSPLLQPPPGLFKGMWGHRKRSPSEGREKRDTEGAEGSVKKTASSVPVEVLDTVFEVRRTLG